MRVLLETVIELSARCGFSRAALLPARVLAEYRPNEEAVRHGIGNDPFALLKGARSVLVVAMPFAFHTPWPTGSAEVSAYYFASQRAHMAIRRLCGELLALGVSADVRQELPLKLLGRDAGLGAIGRNSLLLHAKWGSCFTLRSLVTDLEPPDEKPQAPPQAFPCGECRACVKACPTGALDGSGNLDTALCLRARMLSGEVVPEALRAPMGVKLLGCEVCQRVCPKNARIPSVSPQAEPFSLDRLLRGEKSDLDAVALTIGPNQARKERIQAQAALAAGNSLDRRHLPVLEALSHHARPAVAEHARWAIERLKEET